MALVKGLMEMAKARINEVVPPDIYFVKCTDVQEVDSTTVRADFEIVSNIHRGLEFYVLWDPTWNEKPKDALHFTFKKAFEVEKDIKEAIGRHCPMHCNFGLDRFKFHTWDYVIERIHRT